MKFTKGNKAAAANKGKKKKKTKEWETLGQAITTRHTQRFNEILDNLDDDKFLDRYSQILEYFKPKLARSELTGSEGKKLDLGIVILPSKKNDE